MRIQNTRGYGNACPSCVPSTAGHSTGRAPTCHQGRCSAPRRNHTVRTNGATRPRYWQDVMQPGKAARSKHTCAQSWSGPSSALYHKFILSSDSTARVAGLQLMTIASRVLNFRGQATCFACIREYRRFLDTKCNSLMG